LTPVFCRRCDRLFSALRAHPVRGKSRSSPVTRIFHHLLSA
jgi:hypothetical protein